MINAFFYDGQHFDQAGNLYAMNTLTYPSQSIYQLAEHQIELWEIDLSDESHLDSARTQLKPDELTRAHRFHFARHRRRFSLARAAMRILLSRYRPGTPIVLDYNAYGKPFIANLSIEFNLSHSADTALLAIHPTKPLGVDIEYFSQRDYLGLAKHAFSEAECKQLLRLNTEELPQAFFHIWAQKEALIKAEGLGLSYDTKSFNVSILPPAQLLSHQKALSTDWQLLSFQPTSNCWAALCAPPGINLINYYRFNWQILYENH